MSDLSAATVPSARRHPQYYFTDGNVVLQVGGVLFKVHSSLLVEESETFKDMFTRPTAHTLVDQQLIEHEHEANPQEGTCDENPIVIPEVTQISFSNFLLIFYGRPSDPDFQAIMKDPSTVSADYTFYRLHQYLDIADLSHRFAASKIEAWALEQLKILSGSVKKLAQCEQHVTYQLRAISYARIIRDKQLEHRMRTFVELSYSYLLQESSFRLTGSEFEVHRRNLLKVFNYPNVQTSHPSLFGFIFCIILSLGHEFWLHHPLLDREDRIALLSTQAHLTPLPISILGLDWIEGTLTQANPRGCNPELQSCAQCRFQPVWERAFPGQYIERMKKRESPSGGVGLLALLVEKRMAFVDALPSPNGRCTKNCQGRFVEFIDDKIEHVFVLLADYYKNLE